MTTDRGAQTSDCDPFSDDFIVSPWQELEALRAQGDVVWLSKYKVWCVSRDAVVRKVLKDVDTFSSAHGVGYVDSLSPDAWREPSLVLEVDPPRHDTTRAVLGAVLSKPALEQWRGTLESEAEALVDGLVELGSFDGIRDLAEEFPLRVFPQAVGIEEPSREAILGYGQLAFNGNGPPNDRYRSAMAGAPEIVSWVSAHCRRDALSSSGFGAAVYREAERASLSEREAALLVRSLLSAGVDTTIGALGFALVHLAESPEQWAVLREQPTLARKALDEVVRLESPFFGYFRTARIRGRIGEVRLEPGEKVLVLLAGAGRDPERWERPGEFDLRRKTVGHVGFGFGIHGCVGQSLARLEGEVLLSALARRVETIELLGPPVFRTNNTLRGLESAQVQVRAA